MKGIPGLNEQSLEALLEPLEREQLRALVLRLAARLPEIADLIAGEIAATQVVTPSRAAPARPPVDVGPFQRQVRALLHTSYRSYDSYDTSISIADGIRAILDQVRGFVEGGDSANALSLLEVITEEYSASWVDYDDSYGNLGDVFDDLGALWAEALLSADLSLDELEEWDDQLAEWAGDAADYGSDSGMRLAMKAAQEGWHDPLIVRALRGEPVLAPAPSAVEVGNAEERDEKPDEDEEWDADEDLAADEKWDAEPLGTTVAPTPGPPPRLALIRLRILERQGRLDEYLNLAAAYGLHRERALMLAHLGRVEEAVTVGVKTLTSAADSLALATALREGGQLDAALRVAEHGLGLGGLRGALGDWLASLAPGLGRPDLALRAAEVACASEPSMARYLAARDLAGEGWPALRARLLDELRGGAGGWMGSRAQAEIFLHEGLIDDAISVAERGGYGVLELVMVAAIATRPQWVIKQAVAQAAPIMSGGKAQHYDRAVSWLRHARDAYHAAGQADAWERYLAEVRATYGRKYKLMGLLKGL